MRQTVKIKGAMERPELYDLWISLNRPSADRFAAVLKKRGIKARPLDLKNLFIRDVGSKQIFAPPPRLRGRVTAIDKDQRWMADIIVYNHMPSEHEGTTYRAVLLAQDVFTRYAFAERLENRGQATDAMERILRRASEEGHRTPTVLVTDEDGAFKAASFEALCRSRHIVHEFKAGQNDIATVDRLIGTIRRALAQEAAESGENDWAAQLQKVVKGYNDSPHRKLFGHSPDEASKPPNSEHKKELIFNLRYRGAIEMRHNQDGIESRQDKLQHAGFFRVLLKASRLGRRVYKNVWSEKVHRLAGFDGTGAHAQDSDGRWFPTKELLPVSGDSTQTNLAGAMRAAEEPERAEPEQPEPAPALRRLRRLPEPSQSASSSSAAPAPLPPVRRSPPRMHLGLAAVHAPVLRRG